MSGAQLKSLIGCWVFVIGLFHAFSATHGGAAGGEKDAESRMKMALIHFEAVHKQPERNLAALLQLNREAAEAGAALLLNTEMAVSGYSFQSRQDIAPFTETEKGPTIQAMSRLASDYGVYIGIAFAERDPSTDIYYNSAFLLGPEGRVIARYRKILTERRWARSGNPRQEGVANTPWGRIGMVICADSYSGLIPRTMALKAVDLLWVPANWPLVGGLDPRPVWRARSLENGFYLAACNRTGMDLTLDCRQAVSCVFDPDGKRIFSGTAEASRVFFVEIPLDRNGRWRNVRRFERMGDREVSHYRPIYLRPWVENLTGFYKLPEPGLLSIHCYVPKEKGLNLDELAQRIAGQADPYPALWVLPLVDGEKIETKSLTQLAKRYRVGLAVSVRGANVQPERRLFTPDGELSFRHASVPTSLSGGFPFHIHHFGPAAVAMVPVDMFAHPELATALSKLGCDLVILSESNLSEKKYLLSRVKALAGLAVAACANNGAQITGIQDIHFNWDQKDLNSSGVCTYTLDTAKTRKKMFVEHIDYDLLLTKEVESLELGN
jgi:predicted amidohydrolase